MTTRSTTEPIQELRSAGFDDLAALAERFDAELGDGCLFIHPFLLDAPVTLKALLSKVTDRPDETGVRLREMFRSAHIDKRAGIETALMRACAPRAAMMTVPPEQLFDAAERQHIPDLAGEDESLPTIDLRQKVGRPIDYRGYLCVILKVTRLCNLRCTYCKDWSAQADTTVSIAFLSRLFTQALSGPRAGFDLVLHGGEPLMMGRERFLQMIWLLARRARSGQAVRIHMQSNGTLVDKRWVKLLQLFDVHVSVSLDGSEVLHDKARPDVLGRPTAARTVRGMEMLRAAGLLSGVLVVVTRATVKMGAVALLASLRARGVESVCLLAERPEARAPAVLSAREFVEFLVEVAQARQHCPAPSIAIREIDAAERLLSGVASGFCEMAGNCVGHFVTVDSNGSVSHCDKYVGDEDYTLGNLNDETLESILGGSRTASIRERATSLAVADSSSCPYRPLCQGWCPHERYVAVNSGTRDDHCCGLSPLFAALQEMHPSNPSTKQREIA